MKKKVAILGSTGSIGKTLLKIIKKNKKDFDIILLTANKNYKEILKQTKIFNVQNVIITDEYSYKKFLKINKNKKIKIYNNFNQLKKIFKIKADYIMSSIVGIEGLKPTLNVIEHTKTIAVANKESIICGWNLIKKKLKKFNTEFIPVDSEHFSIWYALKNFQSENIYEITLTASGGPLLKVPYSKFNKLKINQVIKHPNWKMGRKISVDSSTLMNKVFEVIEAKNIFDIPLHKLKILIHPKSYIHAVVCFNNGMIKLIAHNTTMEIPIFNSIYGQKKISPELNNLNIKKLNNLSLSRVNLKKFPLVNILKEIPKKNTLFETVIVSANDELVKLYLNKKIKYQEISKKIIKLIKFKEFQKLKKIEANKVTAIEKIHKYVRLKINSKSV